jgi:AcrR family transcriptional regulator
MATLGPQDFFDAALDLISADGFDALTIGKICSRLRITTGSFYHHFGGLSDFESSLIGHWESEHGRLLVEVAQREEDPVARLALFKQLSINLPHGAEAAIRAWSGNHPDARASQARVDEDRVRVVQMTLLALGLEDARADQLARMSVALLVGSQQMHQSRAQMATMFDELEAWVLVRVGASTPSA